MTQEIYYNADRGYLADSNGNKLGNTADYPLVAHKQLKTLGIRLIDNAGAAYTGLPDPATYGLTADDDFDTASPPLVSEVDGPLTTGAAWMSRTAS